ncbi:hypothetical protein SAMN05216327_102445 [Dyadobacter sp. SG02]|uniref:hypothetical protein n=1 Tax=Dyadobacter sp. SG02 TaxID=1855291 RepID=UPI0008BB2B20|nr:hypothetical protein [Dyadobacter sp. SG02]SEI55817.1 hypothetical protein SAMN05216327_102445 [Dyadobacter sp. SG02]
MNRLILLLLLALAFTQCKRDKDPEPAPEISGITGEWHMVETRYQIGDSTVVKNTTNDEQRAFSIRFDGVMLYDGYASCCAASEYMVNGKPFTVVPLKDLSYDLNCALVDCMACPTLTITQTGDDMTIESCNGMVTKYVRKK